MNVLKQIDGVLEQDYDISGDQEVFDMMMDFATSLDPEQLTDEQSLKLDEIFDYLEPEEEVDEVRFLKRTTRAQRKKAALYRRRHRGQIRAYRRKTKHKRRRAKITGRGFSGVRLGRTRQRPRART